MVCHLPITKLSDQAEKGLKTNICPKCNKVKLKQQYLWKKNNLSQLWIKNRLVIVFTGGKVVGKKLWFILGKIMSLKYIQIHLAMDNQGVC